MAAVAATSVNSSFEEFVALHEVEFLSYLHGVLGDQSEGRGGRVSAEDALQEALLRIYTQWSALAQFEGEVRDERLYRCVRDAAVRALRKEHGQVKRDAESRPRVIAYDFDALHASEEELPPRERELAAAVLGAMVRDAAPDDRGGEARTSLDRGVFVAGLRALSEREAVILIAVDHLGWDQHALAARLGLRFGTLRQTLFCARKIFYALVRHAVGVEVDEEERARLAAYLAGELKGDEKREARRHLKRCPACQELQREMRVFGRNGMAVLSPLPFLFGAEVLAKHSAIKGAAVSGGGAASGLLGQAGAAKALGAVVAVLGVGAGTAGVLADRGDEPRPSAHHVAAPLHSAYAAPPGGMTRPSVATVSTKSASPHRTSRGGSRRQAASSSSGKAASQPSTSNASQTTVQPTALQARTQRSSSPPQDTSGGDGEFFGGP